jgi:hypothetical protein
MPIAQAWTARLCILRSKHHADVARGDREKSKLKQCELVELLMPRQWYLKHLDPDGTKPFREVMEEEATRAQQYYDLIVARTTEGQYTLEDALDLYESFYYIHRQPTWGGFPSKLRVLGVLQVDDLRAHCAADVPVSNRYCCA